MVAAMTLLTTESNANWPDVQSVEINHPHDDTIFGYRIDDVAPSIDRTGKKDVSDALNTALMNIFENGGGPLYLPAGKYRLDKPILIPAGVALRGDFVTPGKGAVDPAKNTILCAYYGRGMGANDEALITLDGSSLIDGVVVWYPEQRIDNIAPYAPSIRHTVKYALWAINGATRNVHLVNAYTGVQLGSKNRGTCIHLIKNVTGTPLEAGVEVWMDADIPRILGVDFTPDYWPASGLGDAPDKIKLADHLINNASGVRYHRTDGSELANIRIRGYHRGLELNDGIQLPNGNWIDNEGHYLNFDIQDCHYAVWIGNIKRHGTQFYGCTLDGRHSAVRVSNPDHGLGIAMFDSCALSGGVAAVSQEWEGEANDSFGLMFNDCEFADQVEWNGGILLAANSKFDFDGPHLEFGRETCRATVVDCAFKGKRNIINRAGAKVKVSGDEQTDDRSPDYTYDHDAISNYVPPRNDSVLVEMGDGKADDAQRIQKAIDGLSKKGGGYVVLLPGEYVLASPLVVRKNVELRGLMDSWQHSKFVSSYAMKKEVKGSLIYVTHGKDAADDAAIVLEEGAGLSGLMFHYPGQEYSTETKEVLHKYAWLVRLKGDRSYVKHVTAVNAWRFIDIATHSPRDTYVGYCNGAPLDVGIHVGESDSCMIDNVHFNSWYWNTVFFPNKPSEFDQKDKYKAELDNWMKANTLAFVFEGSTNLDCYGSFIFCSKQAFTLLPGKNSGVGPDGMVINSGNDWSKYGLYAHANNGLDFANMHFIDVAKYDDDMEISSIHTTPELKSQIDLYNVSTWGGSPAFFDLNGAPESGVNIRNFAYQLYTHDQKNTINGGQARATNLLRLELKWKTEFLVGKDGSLDFRSCSFFVKPDIVYQDTSAEAGSAVSITCAFPEEIERETGE